MATAPPAPDPAELQEDAPASEAAERDRAGAKATKKQLRGSTLLLAGRMLSLAVNFITQVMIVRYLSKTDFGIFSYGLSMVALGEALTTMGLDKGIARFMPIYDERKQYGKLFGTLFMAAGTVSTLGIAFILVAFGLNGFAGGSMAHDPHAITVLMIIICLSPLQSLDDVFMGAFAVFGKPRAIFFRKYVLAPMLRLAAIGLVILSNRGVQELAAGYVIAGGLGIVLYVGMLGKSLKADGLLPHLNFRRLEYPAREIFGFCLPLVVVDLLFVVMNTTNVFMLQMFGSPTDVGAYRVVQPAAKLNLLVMTSFSLLFTPAAARFFAHGDKTGINNLYWRTAAWTAVFSFPVFAMTCMSSHAVTVALFGERYASSAPILALLSLGYYFNAALGYNGLTLRVYGLVKLVVNVSIAAAVGNVIVNLALIPAYGPIGAGIGTCVTLLGHNVLKQWGLRRGTGISVLDPHARRTYGSILLGSLALLAVNVLLSPPVFVAFALAGVVSLAVVRFNRSELQVAETFPELSRIPLIGRILG
jgi:O-antigen/teichoic acid export membrane protein